MNPGGTSLQFVKLTQHNMKTGFTLQCHLAFNRVNAISHSAESSRYLPDAVDNVHMAIAWTQKRMGQLYSFRALECAPWSPNWTLLGLLCCLPGLHNWCTNACLHDTRICADSGKERQSSVVFLGAITFIEWQSNSGITSLVQNPWKLLMMWEPTGSDRLKCAVPQ